MPPELRALAGAVILRNGALTTGLSETSANFSSLAALCGQCLSAGEPQLIDRIVIRGQDALDQPRLLTFVFESITVSS